MSAKEFMTLRHVAMELHGLGHNMTANTILAAVERLESRAPVAAVGAEPVAAMPSSHNCEFSRDLTGRCIVCDRRAQANPPGVLECLTKHTIDIAAPAVAGVPEGWKLVPVGPTPEMLRAAFRIDLSYVPGHEAADRKAIYQAMLAAAPSAPSVAHEADKRIAALESQLAESKEAAAQYRHEGLRILDDLSECQSARDKAMQQLADSREREAKLIADLDANLDAYSDERKRALSAENLARELHELLADYVSQDSIAQGYGSGVGGTTYQKAEAFLDALAADKEQK